MALSNDQVMDRLRDCAADFVAMLRAPNVTKTQLLNGDGKRRGLNHVNELFQMLADDPKSEFKVRE